MSERWFALARSEELAPRHVAQAQLLGQELALWRDDDGRINVWENRCPHRGVRLSLGCNLGATLRCQYHGWRYASGSGQCTMMPAHPQLKPAGGYQVRSFRANEGFGFVWATLSVSNTESTIEDLGVIEPVTMRSTFIEASVPVLRDALLQGMAPLGLLPPLSALRVIHPYRLETSALASHGPARLILLLQPVMARQTLIHALLEGPLPAEECRTLQRAHTACFNALRDRIEHGGRRPT